MGPNPSGSSMTASLASISVSSEVTTLVITNITKLPREGSNITNIRDSLDDTHWVIWCEHIQRIFALCGVTPYVYGTLPIRTQELPIRNLSLHGTAMMSMPKF